MKMKKNIEFIDLSYQQARIRQNIDKAITKALDHGHYIMGPEVKELENQLSLFCNVKHTLTCSNGTDAISLVLMAQDIGPGDAVFVPSFTFAATAEVVALRGATPVFIDVLSDTFNMDPNSLKRGIAKAEHLGLTPKAVIAVDLFGQPVDYESIEKIVHDHNLFLICDSAQGFGATYHGKKVGQLGLATTTSFFPAKPLGCYGDGGAIFTDNDHLAEVIESLRVHGKGTEKYDNIRIGINGRLDTIQAAILLEKLKIYSEEIQLRQKIADHYTQALQDICQTPYVLGNTTSVWAQYTLVLKSQNRAQIMAKLKEKGIPTMIYYPKPLHMQTAYKNYPRADEKLTVSETLAQTVLSLPMHPYLDQDTQNYIIENLRVTLDTEVSDSK
jgi:dTDP-4-amino-4,6-dideoxygalactose transaminase